MFVGEGTALPARFDGFGTGSLPFGGGQGGALAPPEKRDDVAGPAAPAASSGQHEVFLGLEEDLG
jgi:hypothetical protein